MKKILIFFIIFIGLSNYGNAQPSPIKFEYKYVGKNITSNQGLIIKKGYIQLTDEMVILFSEDDKSFNTYSVINHEKMYNNGRPFLAIGTNDIYKNKILIFVFYGSDGNINMVSFKDENNNSITYTDKNYI